MLFVRLTVGFALAGLTLTAGFGGAPPKAGRELTGRFGAENVGFTSAGLPRAAATVFEVDGFDTTVLTGAVLGREATFFGGWKPNRALGPAAGFVSFFARLAEMPYLLFALLSFEKPGLVISLFFSPTAAPFFGVFAVELVVPRM